MTPKESMKKAIKIAGGGVVVAKAIGITPQAIYQWELCPPQWVLGLEGLSKNRVTRHDLRPDIFGPSQEAA